MFLKFKRENISLLPIRLHSAKVLFEHEDKEILTYASYQNKIHLRELFLK